MLQSDVPHTQRRTDVPVLSNLIDAPSTDFVTIFTTIRARWITVLSCIALGLLTACLYLAITPPQFSASALLFIDPKSNITLRGQSLVADANAESANIESQVEILKSEYIARTVVNSQGLVPVLQNYAASSIFSNNSFISGLKFWQKGTTTTPEDEMNLATQALMKRTSVKRLGVTYVVEITAEMRDPVLAARVSNAFAQSYIANQLGTREQSARRTSELLQGRTIELQEQARAAERALEEFKFSGSTGGENSASARVKLRDLESAALTYRMLHDKFLERSAEAAQQQYIAISDAQLVSPALPPIAKSSPKTLITLASALFLGFAAGSALALMRGLPGQARPGRYNSGVSTFRPSEMRSEDQR
jgi:uncharacterized protein involved in exopolysaccharide biosynthesis